MSYAKTVTLWTSKWHLLTFFGKGAGDEDGGGGVYRGVKRKRTGDCVRARKDKEDGVVVPKTPKVYAKLKKKDGKKK